MPQGVGYPEAPMPPEAGAPMGSEPGMEATPDEVMATGEQEAQARRDMLASAAPPPEKPFSIKSIQTLITQFNDTVDAFGGEDLPNVEWTPPEGMGAKWDQPLPPEIYVPLIALEDAMGVVAGGEFVDKYKLVASEITSDTEVRKATAQLSRMAKDKKLVKAMQAPIQPAGEEGAMPEGPPPPSPYEMGEEDRALQENMA